MSGQTFDTKRFLRDRRAALMSMDQVAIERYMKKYGVQLPDPISPEMFWLIVHKARTAATDLPMEARSESKRYLLSVGSQPMDDGDVPV